VTGYLLVRAGGSKYGLRLDQVLEVVDGFEVSPAPRIHSSVRGVTTMRERSVPLVHLASLITNDPAPQEMGRTAVLTRCSGSLVAFEVDDADAVTTEEPDQVPDAWQMPWVCGVVREEGGIVPVMDLDVLGERLSAVRDRE
jgi:chemotaxis signal transduction protein